MCWSVTFYTKASFWKEGHWRCVSTEASPEATFKSQQPNGPVACKVIIAYDVITGGSLIHWKDRRKGVARAVSSGLFRILLFRWLSWMVCTNTHPMVVDWSRYVIWFPVTCNLIGRTWWLQRTTWFLTDVQVYDFKWRSVTHIKLPCWHNTSQPKARQPYLASPQVCLWFGFLLLKHPSLPVHGL